MRLPFVVAEVRGPRACRDDQVVVRHFAVREAEALAWHVDRHCLGQPDFQIVLPPQDPANRRRDVARRERGRRDLIEQRRKDVMVAAIEKEDVDRRPRERARGPQAAKPAANDDDRGRFVACLDS